VGLGLRATRERLETLFGNAQSFELRALPEGGAEACVRIPFRIHQTSSSNEIVAEDWNHDFDNQRGDE
jgi:hypothetical protein